MLVLRTPDTIKGRGQRPAAHRAELIEDWNLARSEAQLKPIAPLE
jgi:hypothetical protein